VTTIPGEGEVLQRQDLEEVEVRLSGGGVTVRQEEDHVLLHPVDFGTLSEKILA
jgi:hypothetical protein